MLSSVVLGTLALVGPVPAGADEHIEAGACGPMDVVFAIDDTGSMGGSIGNVKAGIGSIVADVDLASGGDFQLGLVTFKDTVEVDEDLAAGNEAAVIADVDALVATGGSGTPEASDEALNGIINGLYGFTSANFRVGTVKIVILVTDAPPGGLDDTFEAGVDDVNAATRATEAEVAGILLSAIYVPTGGVDTTVDGIMANYASTTGGSYVITETDGTGTADAISEIIASCGGDTGDGGADVDVKPTSCPNPHKLGKGGVVPVAILGSDTLDVTEIDPATVALTGPAGTVSALRTSIEDVAGPDGFPEPEARDDCGTDGPDGFDDLTAKFSASDVDSVLGAVAKGDTVIVTISAETFGGEVVSGTDIIWIR